MTRDPNEEARFPRATMERLLAEAACWTSVRSIVEAGRLIDEGPNAPPNFLAFAFPDDSLLEAVLMRTFGWFIPAYRVPTAKLAVAARVAPDIPRATFDTLAGWRVNPAINVGPAHLVSKDLPSSECETEHRAFRVDDTPPSLELLFEPLRMLHLTILSLYKESGRLGIIEQYVRKTSDQPTSNVVHRHYGDGALIAALDALIYFARGHAVGVQWGEKRQSIENSFRSVNVVGQPPLDVRLFDVGRQEFTQLMNRLGDNA